MTSPTESDQKGEDQITVIFSFLTVILKIKLIKKLHFKYWSKFFKVWDFTINVQIKYTGYCAIYFTVDYNRTLK